MSQLEQQRIEFEFQQLGIFQLIQQQSFEFEFQFQRIIQQLQQQRIQFQQQLQRIQFQQQFQLQRIQFQQQFQLQLRGTDNNIVKNRSMVGDIWRLIFGKFEQLRILIFKLIQQLLGKFAIVQLQQQRIQFQFQFQQLRIQFQFQQLGIQLQFQQLGIQLQLQQLRIQFQFQLQQLRIQFQFQQLLGKFAIVQLIQQLLGKFAIVQLIQQLLGKFAIIKLIQQLFGKFAIVKLVKQLLGKFQQFFARLYIIQQFIIQLLGIELFQQLRIRRQHSRPDFNSGGRCGPGWALGGDDYLYPGFRVLQIDRGTDQLSRAATDGWIGGWVQASVRSACKK